MPPRVTLTANYARPSMRRNAFAFYRRAKALRGAAPGPTKLEPGPLAMDTAGVPVDNGLWMEPNTGVIMLQPGPLWSTFMEDEYWSDDWFGSGARPNQLTVASGALAEQVRDDLGASPILWATLRPDPLAPIDELASVDTWLTSLDAGGTFDLSWVAKTARTMRPNEGFSMLIQPLGTMSDRADVYMGVAFGGRFFLSLHASGYAWLWTRRSATEWAHVQRLEFAAGGIDHGSPFQLTVVPWGPDNISIVFSQAGGGGETNASNTDTGVRSAFLIECKRWGITCPSDPSIGVTRKTEGTSIFVGVRSTEYQVAFGLAAVRYVATGVRTLPEPLPEVMTHAVSALAPKATSFGIVGQTEGVGLPATLCKTGDLTTVGTGYTDENGALASVAVSWDAATDRQVSLRTWLRPSHSGIYTPELWAMQFEVPPEIVTPTTEEIDLSAHWRKLSWQATSEMAGSVLEALVSVESLDTATAPPTLKEDYKKLLTMGGTIKLEVDETVVFEGVVRRRRPVVEGGVEVQEDDLMVRSPRRSLIVSDDLLIEDLWHELDDTSAAGIESLSRQTIGAILREGFKRAGFPDSELSIDPELDTVTVDGVSDSGGDDWKLVNDDATVGDLLRALRSNYGRQGQPYLHVMRQGGMWVCRFSKPYTSVEDLDHVFHLSMSTEPTELTTDEERWADHRYRLFDQMEPVIERGSFNALACYSSTRTGDGADAIAAFIAPDPRAWDPEFPAHEVRARMRQMTASDTAMASTLDGLARYARRLFDEQGRMRVSLAMEGEWGPDIWPDDLVAIVGPAPADDVDRGIEVGDPVSYGAWRIVSCPPELEHDNPEAPGADDFGGTERRDYTWSALYTLEYVGTTDFEEAPMWTADEFLPEAQ